jgi:hypothetical protein
MEHSEASFEELVKQRADAYFREHRVANGEERASWFEAQQEVLREIIIADTGRDVPEILAQDSSLEDFCI